MPGCGMGEGGIGSPASAEPEGPANSIGMHETDF